MPSTSYSLSFVLRAIAKQRRHRYRQVHMPTLLGTLVVLGLAVPAVFFWHQHQLHWICAALVDHADQMESDERWKEAANALYRYWKIRPEAEVVGRLAQNYDKAEGHRDRWGVIRSYQRAVGVLPRRTDLRNRLSELLVHERQYGLALEQTEHVLARQPDDRLAWKVKSLATWGAYKQGQPIALPEVRSTLEQAFQRQPDDIQLAKALTDVIRQEMKAVPGSQLAREADQIMDRLVAASPGDARGHLARYQYRTRYQLPGAPHDLQQALMLAPNDPGVVQQAAWDAHRDRDWLAARVLFKNLVELWPDCPDGYIGMGDVEIFSGRPARAISIWLAGRKRSVTTLPLLLRLAEAQIQLARLDAAQQSLEEIDQWLGSLASRGIEQERHWATTSASLLWGRWHLANGAPRRAIPHVRAAAILGTNEDASEYSGLRPVAYSARVLLGETYAGLGQWDDAAAAFEQALQLRLDSVGTMLSAAEAWGRLGQLQRALLRASQALHQPDSPAFVSLRYAQLLFERELSAERRDWSRFEAALKSARVQTANAWEVRLLEVDYQLARWGPRAESEVVKILGSLERSRPDCLPLWRCLPLYYEALGLNERTDSALARLDELTGSGLEARIRRADVLLGRGRTAEARALLSACQRQQLSATEQQALDFSLLRLLETEGHHDAIESALIELTAKYPTQTETIETLLDRRFAAKKVQGQDPSTASLIAQLKRRQAEIQTGWQYYAARFDLDRSPPDANTFARLQSYLRSLEDRRPHWSKTSELAGRLALHRGDTDRALGALEDAVRRKVAEPPVYEMLLRQYLTDGNYLAIWRLADQWLQNLPLGRPWAEGIWPEAHQKLEVPRAWAARRIPEAAWDQAQVLREGRAGDMIWLWMLLRKNGDRCQADALLEDFLRQNPHIVAAWMMRLKDDVESQDMAQARRTLARLQSLDMKPAALKPFVLGQAFQLMGLWKESRRAYRKVDPKSRYRLQAEIYLTAVAHRRNGGGDAAGDQAHGNSAQKSSSKLIAQ